VPTRATVGLRTVKKHGYSSRLTQFVDFESLGPTA
jgi:hypothetical protein